MEPKPDLNGSNGVRLEDPDLVPLTFSVVTVSWNRASTLPRVYKSLGRQTFRDFEWLIVDDGSDDDTPRLTDGWTRECDFRIRVVRQKNTGLPGARNRGVAEARGRFVVFLDSDDACVPNALERLNFHWESIPEPEREGFAGVTVLCNDQHGRPVGKALHISPLDSNTLEMTYRYKYSQEMWGTQRADILRSNPFANVRGAAEGITWNTIARRYRTRYINERLRIYYINEPGRRDQSSHGPIGDRVTGAILTQQHLLNDNADWFRYDPRHFLLLAVHYARFCFHSGRGPLRQLSELEPLLPRALGLAALPLGFAAYLLDRRRGR